MFIAVEGIDGSGKSTTITELERYIRSKNREVIVTAEPTTLQSGRIIRDFLDKKNIGTPLIHEMMALSFAADRINHLREVIWPALKKKRVVITDRYFFSSLAYQSLNISYEWVKGINRFATLPDILVFIDVSIKTAMDRLNRFRNETEIYEQQDMLTQIDNNYKTVLSDFAGRVQTIHLNGELKPSEIYGDIEQKFRDVNF